MWPFKRQTNADDRYFNNDRPIQISNWADLQTLNFEEFPIVDDFEIVLKQTEIFGLHLYYHSRALGRVASFPWWDNVEKDLPRYTTERIPTGELEGPFDDLEQGWKIIIFEIGNYVYIMESYDEDWEVFSTWFRVPQEQYYAEWMRIIREFNPMA